MRFISDFVSGMRTGLTPDGSSYTTRRGNTKARSTGPKAKSSSPIMDVLVRASILVLCVTLGSLAFFASSKVPLPIRSIQPIRAWTAQMTFPEEVLTTDASVPPRDWKYIVLHHSASLRGSAEIFDQAH